MKRWMMVGLCVVVSAALCQAGGFKIGAHGAYTLAGDVEDEQGGMGAQIGVAVNDTFSLELAGTWIEEEVAAVDIDVFAIALSARLGTDAGEGVNLYIGGGVNYNMFELGLDNVNDPDDEAGFHGCAGLEIDLGENLQLFAEYRHSWVEYTVDPDNNIDKLSGDQDYEYGLARAGINIVM